jgi:hypothetical protein
MFPNTIASRHFYACAAAHLKRWMIRMWLSVALSTQDTLLESSEP